MTPYSYIPIPPDVLCILRQHKKADVAKAAGITRAAAAKVMQSGRARCGTLDRYVLAARMLATQADRDLVSLLALAGTLLPSVHVNVPSALYRPGKLATACRGVLRAQKRLTDAICEMKETYQ